jgi:hypothetical protein
MSSEPFSSGDRAPRRAASCFGEPTMRRDEQRAVLADAVFIAWSRELPHVAFFAIAVARRVREHAAAPHRFAELPSGDVS